MRVLPLLLLSVICSNLAGCTPRLQGSYTVHTTVFIPDHETLTFTGHRFRSCYDGVNNGAIGSGTFTLRRGILTLHYGPTPAYVPSTAPWAMPLPESRTRRVPAGTVERYRYAPLEAGQQAFRLAEILPPVDKAFIKYQLSLGVPAEELKVANPEFRTWRRISAEEAAGCLQE